MLTVAFGELWYNRLKEGREDVNHDARPSCPSTPTIDENIEAVKKMTLDNRWITIGEVADEGISLGSCQAIFTDVLDMKRVLAKIVSKLLNFKQKQRGMDIAQEMWTTFNDDPDLL